MTTTAAPAPAITFPIEAQAGAATIAVHRIPGGYSLLTTALGQDLTDWCGTYTDLKAALGEASRVLAAFQAHGTADRIEAHANGLRIRLAQETSRPARMQDMARIRDLAAELDQIEDLGTKRARAALRNQFAA